MSLEPREINDLYTRLKVTKDASSDELKASYRKLALKYHPDRNPNDIIAEENCKAVNEAYGILSKPKNRMNYDILCGHRPLTKKGFANESDPLAGIKKTGEKISDKILNYLKKINEEAERKKNASDLEKKVRPKNINPDSLNKAKFESMCDKEGIDLYKFHANFDKRTPYTGLKVNRAA